MTSIPAIDVLVVGGSGRVGSSTLRWLQRLSSRASGGASPLRLASGGRSMMEACVEMLARYPGSRPLLTAVTILTSLEQSDLLEVGLDIEPMVQVQRLARLAQDCGLDGVVCSAREARALRGALGDDFLLVTPGIRPAESVSDDQKRIVTPEQAIDNGSSYLVIGRPITRSDNPGAALETILANLRGAC